MKKLFAMLVMMAAIFTAFNVAQAVQDRDYDRVRDVEQCSLDFERYNTDGSGLITYHQFQNAWYGLGTMKGITPHAMPQAFAADRNNDGYISIGEFCGRWEQNTINPRMRG